ncbi:DUF5134 domain-containing protein [Streptomyces sp. SP17BM10]|uniref:DUF5134 domain-containing protein n=1 Tax=Streptomyces sp. SP17BM10 TaxID=3002530 RepID=UPI002E79C527|nr:DUF5134 domain-containing protein [Streptomyces sp. SP17BM10]MEE1787264.1 DUF5134 domain-containing protein [Streptomyces sp. SP17BM10]
MHGPTLVNWLLALLTATAGAHCLARLRHAPGSPHAPDAPHALHTACAPSPAPPSATHPTGPRRLLARETDAAEALMGLGMAGMAVTGAAVPASVWAWLFGIPAAVFLLAAAGTPDRRGHRLHHAVGGLAMAYAALAMTASHGHHHHVPSTGAPLLTGALLLYFGAYSLWTGTRLLHAPDGTVTVGTAGLPQACRLTMGIGMFAMLLGL